MVDCAQLIGSQLGSLMRLCSASSWDPSYLKAPLGGLYKMDFFLHVSSAFELASFSLSILHLIFQLLHMAWASCCSVVQGAQISNMGPDFQDAQSGLF